MVLKGTVRGKSGYMIPWKKEKAGIERKEKRLTVHRGIKSTIRL